jgi:hypothetical protein
MMPVLSVFGEYRALAHCRIFGVFSFAQGFRRDRLALCNTQILVQQAFVALLNVDAAARLALFGFLHDIGFATGIGNRTAVFAVHRATSPLLTTVPTITAPRAPRSMQLGFVAFAGMPDSIVRWVEVPKSDTLHLTASCPTRYTLFMS